MKKLSLNELKPVKVLSKNEQKAIKGGTSVPCSCNGSSVGSVSCDSALDCASKCWALCVPQEV